MNTVRGRVRGGHIEIDSALPEGAEVVVLTASPDEAFELDEAQLAELESRMVEADRGEVEPAESVLASLRRSR
jgi:predicted transcriptional regulator